jgi:hypothetical protein
MERSQENLQQKFKEMLQDIYVIGEETESICTSEFIIEIKKILSTVVGKPN